MIKSLLSAWKKSIIFHQRPPMKAAICTLLILINGLIIAAPFHVENKEKLYILLIFVGLFNLLVFLGLKLGKKKE